MANLSTEAWEWYYKTIGNEQSPIVDTWWQTETGGILITPLPGATELKPGSATRPFFGVQPALVDNMGNIVDGATEGNLVILDSWPGQMRTVYGDHERFEQTYFSTFKGMYFTGDGARVMKMATTGSQVVLMTYLTSLVTVWVPLRLSRH